MTDDTTTSPTALEEPADRPPKGGEGTGGPGGSAGTDTSVGAQAQAPAGGGCPVGAGADTRTLPPVRFWPALDLTAVEFDPVLAELMREGPVTRIRLPNGEGWAWLVTRHDDVRMVTNDARFSRAAVMDYQVTRLAPHFIPVPGAVGFADPPEHTRLRRAVAPAFTARGVESVRERSAAALHEMVDRLLAEGPPADLTERVLSPFPIAVICELMGVPEEGHERMHTWTQLILSSSHGAKVSEQAKDEMAACFTELIRSRRGSTAEDVTSLLGAAVGRQEMSLDEAVGLAVLIQIGGEAVTNNSGQMFYLLLTRPELAERLRAEPEMRAQAIDELLRYIPHRSAVGLSRIAMEDVVIRGAEIRKGEPVYVSYLAANRDPEVFPDPDRIDFERMPNPHVSFGHGPHYCPGGILARMETELMVNTLLDRMPGLRLAVPPEDVPWRLGALIRGPEALPVTW
ncbi:cytochrome P450 [Streptomyces sp. TS71-3]|uniref:cytochrome P450 n=1 Tax=Streptomyces sp. TS71-3 TaxID=2733862 RepID=UPI001B26574E|nr:cytochrome P450 [Streptomyces sp. TS71-3]GHJ39175.1 biflaviolin synthase CYP158A2 [Streptomyces sp. TS71-3]